MYETQQRYHGLRVVIDASLLLGAICRLTRVH